jgi:hypothetical protein
VKLEGVKRLLLDIYEGTDKGELHDFLGLTIHRDHPRCLLYIDQATDTRKIVRGARLVEEAKFQSISLPPNQQKDPPGATMTPEATARYRHTVGELLYLANMSRPDLACSAGYIARHLPMPTSANKSQLKHVLRYLHGTTGFVLTLGHQSEVNCKGYVDSDWAQEPGRKIVFGYVFQMQGSSISWKSKRMNIVARSSMEAEFIAAGEAVQEALHLQWLRYFLQKDSSAIPMHTDSRCVLSLIRNHVVEDMRKHIDVILNHVREREDAGYIQFSWVSGTKNVADVFTKALPKPAFEKHRDSLDLSVADH